MKKLCFISMVCVAMMFVSCGKKATTLEGSIPNDAVMVMRFDVKSMISKSEYNLFDNQTVKAAVEMAKLALTEPQKKLLEDFQKNANSFGIDIKGSAYFYMNEQVIGILLSVNDAKKVFENLKAIDPSFEMLIKQEKDVYSISLGGQEIIWNKEKMMFLANYSQFLGENQEEIDYFNLPKSKSVVSDVNYQKFAKTKGDISLYYSMSNYGNFIKKIINVGNEFEKEENAKVKEMMDKMIALYDNFKGVSAIMNCNFEKGKIVSSVQTLYATKEDEKKITELYDYSDVKLSGEFFKYIPQNPLFLLAMGFDGEKMLAMFDKMGITSLLDEMMKELDKEDVNFDYKALISSINGDILMSFYNGNLTNNNFSAEGSIFVKLKNTDAVKSLLDLLKAKIGDGKDLPVEFGIKDDFFYFTMKGGLVEKENDLMKKIKDQPMFIYGDLTGLNESLKPLYEKDANLKMFSSVIGKGLSLVETYESKYIDKDNVEFVCNFTDKKENSLKQFFGFIDEVINSVGTMTGSSLFGGGRSVEYYDEEEVVEID